MRDFKLWLAYVVLALAGLGFGAFLVWAVIVSPVVALLYGSIGVGVLIAWAVLTVIEHGD